MGSMSMMHWIVLLAIVLILFGAGRLPRVMGDFAKGIKAFKSGMEDEGASHAQATPTPVVGPTPGYGGAQTAYAPTPAPAYAPPPAPGPVQPAAAPMGMSPMPSNPAPLNPVHAAPTNEYRTGSAA